MISVFLSLILTLPFAMALFEGDMKVFYKDVARAYDEELADKLKESGDLIDDMRRALGTEPGYLRKWTDGVVPYVINEESTFTESQQEKIKAELKYFSKVAPVITFREKLNNDTNFLSFDDKDSGCWSYLGMIGGKQTINLGDDCLSRRTIHHELLHALGFWHEQSRPDRDLHVKVLEENVKTGYMSQFKIRSSIDSLGSPYDTKSVMHYGMKTFSKNGQNTMEPVDGTGGPFGSSEMTIIDRNQLAVLYGGDTVPPTSPPTPPPSMSPACNKIKWRKRCRRATSCRWKKKIKKCVKK